MTLVLHVKHDSHSNRSDSNRSESKESTKPVMLRLLSRTILELWKNIVYHFLRQLDCWFQGKVDGNYQQKLGTKKWRYCTIALHGYFFFGGGGFPYINQIGEYLYFTYLKRLVKQLLVFQVYETPRCSLSPASMAPLPRYRPRRLGAGGKVVPGESSRPKQSGWSLGSSMDQGFQGPTKWAVRLVDLDGLPG